MSGIFGYIGSNGAKKPDDAVVRSACVSMDSRGDEEQRVLVSENIGIGISAGPASCGASWFDDGRICVAASGELYGAGSTGIAEKVAAVYKGGDEMCARSLDGNFHFCIWDRAENKVILATDHFGTTALSYYYNGRTLVFASKPRAILKSGIARPGIDKAALYNYCVFTFVPTPRTIYEHIQKLPPGHIMTISNVGMKIRQYWDIRYSDGKEREEEYYCGEIRAGLERATRDRFDPACESDTAGAFLSGGLDSSTVAGLMRKLAGREVKTFSIIFDEAKYSEAEYVTIAAKHFGLKSHTYCIRPGDLVSAINALIKEHDEPFGNSSAIAAYYCMKLAKDSGVDVLLGGDGGDENFGGYERYVTDKVFSLYQRLPEAIRKGLMEPLFLNRQLRGAPFFKKAANYIERSNIPDPERFCFYELYSMRKRREIFSDTFLEGVEGDGPLKVLEAHFNGPDTKAALNRLMYLDTKIGLIDNDLRNKMDKTAQAFGMRVRYPMLDPKLWALGAEIPARLKLKGFTKKYIYKKAFSGFLPEKIIGKKKHGFGLPFAVWLREDPGIRKFVREILLDPVTNGRGYFKKGFFESMLKLHDSETTTYYGDILWGYLMLELWHREWIDR